MFPKTEEMVKTNSERGPPFTTAPPALHSWHHPSPTAQICCQDKLSHGRSGLLQAPCTPSPGSATQLRVGERESSLDQPLCQDQTMARVEPRQARGVDNQQQNQGITNPAPPAAWIFHGFWEKLGFPLSSTRKEASKGLGGSSLCIFPQRGC